jgi:hypothetical protein
MKQLMAIALASATIALPLCGDTVMISATADTWITNDPFKGADSNLNGDFNGLGCGYNSHGAPMRAMFTFDVSSIPANATITAVSVSVDEIKEKSFTSMDYELHRILQPWVVTEATWNSSAAGIAWNTPGLGAGSDYVSAPSATFSVGTGVLGPDTFNSTSSLVSDVQAWVANPSSNHGWFFKAATETALNARRWGSTSTGDPAILSVTYTASAPPPQQPTLSPPSVSAGQFQFTFNAEANVSYTVESRPAFDASSWTTFKVFLAAPTATNYVVTDPVAQVTTFYRVKTP